MGFSQANNGAGAVNVLLGSATGLTAAGSQYWPQDSRGIEGIAVDAFDPDDDLDADAFGSGLLAVDFGWDGHADLAIGAAQDNAGRGGVNVIYGSAVGLRSAGNEYWTPAAFGSDARHTELEHPEGPVSVVGPFAAAKFGRGSNAGVGVGRRLARAVRLAARTEPSRNSAMDICAGGCCSARSVQRVGRTFLWQGPLAPPVARPEPN